MNSIKTLTFKYLTMNIHILSLLSVATIAQVSIATAQTAPRVNILFCVADEFKVDSLSNWSTEKF